MSLELTLLRDAGDQAGPSGQEIQSWAAAALAAAASNANVPVALTVRIVDASESQRLNLTYRNKDRPTNVLAFPADTSGWPRALLKDMEFTPLGDLAICGPLVDQEAAEQDKPPEHHWAHLVVHGVLHLLGHDHQDADEAARMEALERDILRGLGVPDPYA